MTSQGYLCIYYSFFSPHPYNIVQSKAKVASPTEASPSALEVTSPNPNCLGGNGDCPAVSSACSHHHTPSLLWGWTGVSLQNRTFSRRGNLLVKGILVGNLRIMALKIWKEINDVRAQSCLHRSGLMVLYPRLLVPVKWIQCAVRRRAQRLTEEQQGT